MEPAAPLAIEGFHILGLLGSGGMGQVYLAEDRTLGRRVAIKVISKDIANGPEGRARFLREARAMASVEHPRIVRVYGFGEAAGQAYLVMEYVQGETLADRIRRVGRLSADEACRILRQAVEALDEAWRQHIVHRDIKPSNILLDKRDDAHVADFGLAKSMRMDAETVSETHGLLGTPYYVSPEQARDHPLDCRSDMYSLGIVLYEMLAGDRPFQGRTPFEVVDQHLHQPLPSIRERRPELGDAVIALVSTLTQKDPDARPASYAELLRRIDAVAAQRHGGRRRVPRPAASRRLLLGAVALTALLFSGAWWAWTAFMQPAAKPPSDASRLVVAIAPFYGPDDESAREGKVIAAMIEQAVVKRLGSDARVLGGDETKQPVRTHDAARSLGRGLHATMVVWGEAFVVRGETEIQPHFTMVPRDTTAARAQSLVPQTAALLSDPLAAVGEREGGATVVQAQVANQIELRRTGADGVGNVVLLLAGTYALYTENNAQKALKLFDQVPRSAESQRYRAEALLTLGRDADARNALENATALAPADAQSYASLGDLHLQTGRFADAVSAYRRAVEIGGAYTTHRGIYYDGKIYAKETYVDRYASMRSDWLSGETGYLLAFDPVSHHVVERYRLPGALKAITPSDQSIQITYGYGSTAAVRYATIGFSGGQFDRPIFLGTSLLMRRQATNNGVGLAGNFRDNRNPPPVFGAQPVAKFDDLPKTLPELETAARQAFDNDPTQPWHLFVLGEALWHQDRRDDAARAWEQMFNGSFAATPYFEFDWMASHFDRHGQPEWADRAYDEALKRRRQIPVPIEWTTLIERLINMPVQWDRQNDDRRYAMLQHLRQLSGVTEAEDLVAAIWQHHFEKSGDGVRASAEAEYLTRARGNPSSMITSYVATDYALYVTAATSAAFWIVLGVLSIKWRGRVASIPASERRLLCVALLVALLGWMPSALMINRLFGFYTVAIGSDSTGHAYIVNDLEEKLAATNSSALRFAAAVSNHLAGNVDRARTLYESIPDDPRARTNLDALRTGNLVPPEPLTGADFFRAYRSAAPPYHLRTLWEHLGEALPVLKAVIVANLMIGAVLIAGLLLMPVAPPSAPLAVGGRGGRGVLKTLSVLVPGTIDIANGAVLRGYVALMIFLFPASVGISHLIRWTRALGPPAPGLFTATSSQGLLRAFPLPGPVDPINRLALHYGTLFWAYPYARVFWTVVAIVAVTSLALHGIALRSWRAAIIGSPAEPSAAPARRR